MKRADNKPSSPLGLCVLPEPEPNLPRTCRYSRYVEEILAHAGFACSLLSIDELADRLSELRVLVTVGNAALPENAASLLAEWVERGGAWIAVAGTCGLDSLLGVEVIAPSWTARDLRVGALGEGYLQPAEPRHKTLEHVVIPLHFFNGIPVRPTAARSLASALDAHHRPTDRAAMTENVVGSGRCILIAPDVTGAVVRIQQGTGPSRDGVPAPDGTACIDDCVSKSDDGAVLDWLLDRQPVDGVEGFSAFLQPIADQWRELLIRAVLYACRECELDLPLLWLYPRNVPALGEISHDTDLCEASKAFSMLRVLSEAAIHTTWCVILPGYPPEVIAAIRDAGHELAVHYDALNGPWGEAEFAETVSRLSEIFGDPAPVTNKNHYLRWEGDTEFFDWCVANGIEMDQTKGPTKGGNVGFTFGTCHPHFPVDAVGRPIDVIELPTLTQDLLIVAPRELAAHLADAAAKSHGVMHLLFHPSHIEKPGVADALLGAVEVGRRQGMEFWTARSINDWERARRSVRWRDWSSDPAGSCCVLRAERPMAEATVLWLSSRGNGISADGTALDTVTVTRWGFEFQSATFDLRAQDYYHMRITNEVTRND